MHWPGCWVGKRRWGVMAMVLLVLWAVSGREAWAHVTLLSAVPEPGATLAASPKEVRLTFDGEIAPAVSQVMLFNDAFQSVDDVVMLPDAGASNELAAQVPPLEYGRYTVQWAVVSSDGHPISGSYTFALVEPSFFQRLLIPLLVVLLLAIIGGAALYWTRIQANKH